jgi:acid phosphatase family membrane protein YuiD
MIKPLLLLAAYESINIHNIIDNNKIKKIKGHKYIEIMIDLLANKKKIKIKCTDI